MSTNTTKAWTKSQALNTLAVLHDEYPGYTNNELYSIWCRDHGKLPLDSQGKIDLEWWKTQAEHDGEHVIEGGFRVSRALYGRALNAEKGVSKAKRAPRKTKEAAGVGATELENGSVLSPEAVALAKDYDRAQAVFRQAVAKYAEALDWMEQLRGTDRLVLRTIARSSTIASRMIDETGLLDSSVDAALSVAQKIGNESDLPSVGTDLASGD